MGEDFKMNDVVYIMRNGIVAKAKIEEIIFHHTQTKIITKYIVHAYGIKEHLTMEFEDLCPTLENAKEKARQAIEDVYVNSMANLKNVNEEFFDQKEKELIGE